MNLPFTKWVGAGNDFIFILDKALPPSLPRPSLAKEICDRQFGVGADGLVIVKPLDVEESQFIWDFYNSDGSSAEMCGNAARCAIRFIHQNFGFQKSSFQSLAGLIEGFDGDLVEVHWTIASDAMKKTTLKLENFKSFEGFFIDTGVPHFVLLNPGLDLTRDDCLAIQSHPQFGLKQTNVTVLDTESQAPLCLTKTFERGVRGFTLACGTGVIASAFVLQNLKKQDQYNLRAPGGDLSVRIDGQKVTLIGPAEKIFEGTYPIKETS
jgi:diaminopimelate epimerase